MTCSAAGVKGGVATKFRGGGGGAFFLALVRASILAALVKVEEDALDFVPLKTCEFSLFWSTASVAETLLLQTSLPVFILAIELRLDVYVRQTN